VSARCWAGLRAAMVWKSERWQAKLDDEVPPDATIPSTLEITYVRDVGVEPQTEVVYEDPGEAGPPRLLVSLSAVTALKDLCEHEHAKYDKTVRTLGECRASYYRELRWLREQLHLAYRTDAEAMARKATLTHDDFEVYWFEPPHYIDDELKEFLVACIRQTNQKLITENSELKEQLNKAEILKEGGVRAVLRNLRKDHTVPKILRELYGLLKGKDLQEFEEAALLLLQGRGVDVPSSLHASRDLADLMAANEELEALRQKSRGDQAALAELHAKLAQRVDADLERERANAERDRADAERRRADLIQQRAERLERQYQELRQQLEVTALSSGAAKFELDRTSRLNKSVSKLSEALLCLTPTSSTTTTPNVSPICKRKNQVSFIATPFSPMAVGELAEKQAPPETFDEALVRLDEVANGFDAVAQGVLAELQYLRAQTAQLQAVNLARERAEDASVQNGQDARRNEVARTAEHAAAMDAASKAEAHAISLGREVAEGHAHLKQEREKNNCLQAELDEHRRKLEEANGIIERLQGRMAAFSAKVEKLKGKIRSLQASTGGSDALSDEDDDLEDLADFMIPYRMRVAAAAAGKQRWQLLSEDATFSRKKREYLLGQKLRIYRAPQPGEEAVVSAAFQFLRNPSEPSSPKQAVASSFNKVVPGQISERIATAILPSRPRGTLATTDAPPPTASCNSGSARRDPRDRHITPPPPSGPPFGFAGRVNSIADAAGQASARSTTPAGSPVMAARELSGSGSRSGSVLRAAAQAAVSPALPRGRHAAASSGSLPRTPAKPSRTGSEAAMASPPLAPRRTGSNSSTGAEGFAGTRESPLVSVSSGFPGARARHCHSSVPLTNASAAAAAARDAGQARCTTGAAFSPEMLPAFPPGRTKRGCSSPPWP